MALNQQHRKKAEAYIFSILEAIDPSGINLKIGKECIPQMSDAEFVEMAKMGIPLYQPVGGKTKISYKRNIKIAQKMNIPLEEKVWLTEPKTGLTHLTRHPHLILLLPVRRQTQMLEKKMSVAKHDKVRDKITGQVTGPSKASGISFPEAYIIYSDKLDESLQEFLHARGGNEAVNRAFYQAIRMTGRGRIHIPGAERTSAKSTRSWASYYKAMGIGTNIGRPQ